MTRLAIHHMSALERPHAEIATAVTRTSSEAVSARSVRRILSEPVPTLGALAERGPGRPSTVEAWRERVATELEREGHRIEQLRRDIVEATKALSERTRIDRERETAVASLAESDAKAAALLTESEQLEAAALRQHAEAGEAHRLAKAAQEAADAARRSAERAALADRITILSAEVQRIDQMEAVWRGARTAVDATADIDQRKVTALRKKETEYRDACVIGQRRQDLASEQGRLAAMPAADGTAADPVTAQRQAAALRDAADAQRDAADQATTLAADARSRQAAEVSLRDVARERVRSLAAELSRLPDAAEVARRHGEATAALGTSVNRQAELKAAWEVLGGADAGQEAEDQAAAVVRLVAELQAAKQRRDGLDGHLRAAADKDPAAALQGAEADLDRAEEAYKAIERQASAAKTLWETIKAVQSETRAALAAPGQAPGAQGRSRPRQVAPDAGNGRRSKLAPSGLSWSASRKSAAWTG